MKDQGTVKKIHSLIDKVYHLTNLRKAWETVRANNGSGGIDKVSVPEFDQLSNEELDRLHQQLKDDINRFRSEE